ncbi:MAG: Lrp/AsnC family transcriptional regulator [archaeon]
MVKIKRDLAFMYSENARIKIKVIAGLLRTSSQRIKYLLKTLEKDSFVYNPHCIIDYSYFGLLLFRVYFKGAYISEKHKSEIIKKLAENEYVVAIYELSGEYDLVVEIQAPNPSRFNKELREITSNPQTLRHYKTALNIVTYLYPRYYLTKDEELQTHVSPQIIIGGDRKIRQFDENETKVIMNIMENPKIRMASLARKSGLNVRTANNILSELKKKKIIKGFKQLINTDKLEVYAFRLYLKLHNISKASEEELMQYLLKTREIVQVNKTVGDWDMEIDIEALNKTRIRQLTIEIRDHFKDIIETFNMMEFYDYYMRSYLPKYLFALPQTI